ncbi:hypothetical protein ID866_11034 [Astraeus odoratus]|nr:hypothetical protein ID866_11034 [Astraeus odoratus]
MLTTPLGFAKKLIFSGMTGIKRTCHRTWLSCSTFEMNWEYPMRSVNKFMVRHFPS